MAWENVIQRFQYDLIGRVIPGVAFWTSVIFVFEPPEVIKILELVKNTTSITSFSLVLGVLILCYVTGFILGAISYVIESFFESECICRKLIGIIYTSQVPKLAKKDNACKDKDNACKDDLLASPVSYKYDVIKLFKPEWASTLSKLHGELQMSSSFFLVGLLLCYQPPASVSSHSCIFRVVVILVLLLLYRNYQHIYMVRKRSIDNLIKMLHKAHDSSHEKLVKALFNTKNDKEDS